MWEEELKFNFNILIILKNVKNLYFTPQSNFGSQNPKLKGIKSSGEDLRNYKTINRIELKWLIKSYNQFEDKNKFFRNDFDKLAGSSNLKKQIIEGISESEIRELVTSAISECGAKRMTELGLVMKVLKPKIFGRANLRIFNGMNKFSWSG